MTDLSTKNLKLLLDNSTPGPWMVSDTELPDYIINESGCRVLWNSDQAVPWCNKDEDVFLAAAATELALEVIRLREKLGEHDD